MSYQIKKLYAELTEIDAINEPFKVFDLISKTPDLSWREIFELIEKYRNFLFQETDYYQLPYAQFNSKYLRTEEFISKFEVFGIDFNHLDYNNDNLLLFLTSTSKTNLPFDFTEELIDYVISKTNNIYHKNNQNRHVLYNLMSIDSGAHGEKFFQILKKNPDFDLHEKDKYNSNLLYECLKHSFSPYEIVLFLNKNNLDFSMIETYSNNSILHNFLFKGALKANVDLFTKYAKHVDIGHKNKHNENIVDSFLLFIKSSSITQSSLSNYSYWLEVIVELLVNKKCLITETTISNINDSFNKHLVSENNFYPNEQLLGLQKQINVLYLQTELNKTLIEPNNKQKFKI